MTSESGAATSDFVVLTAGITILGVVALGSVLTSATFVSGAVALEIEQSTTLSYAAKSQAGSSTSGVGALAPDASAGDDGVDVIAMAEPTAKTVTEAPDQDDETGTPQQAEAETGTGAEAQIATTEQTAEIGRDNGKRTGQTRADAKTKIKDWLKGRDGRGASDWARSRSSI